VAKSSCVITKTYDRGYHGYECDTHSVSESGWTTRRGAELASEQHRKGKR